MRRMEEVVVPRAKTACVTGRRSPDGMRDVDGMKRRKQFRWDDKCTSYGGRKRKRKCHGGRKRVTEEQKGGRIES